MDKFLIIMNQTKDGVSAYLMRGGKIERNVDVKNDDLKLEKTKKHYLEYSKIAQKANLDRADIKEFVLKIESLCSTKVVEINP